MEQRSDEKSRLMRWGRIALIVLVVFTAAESLSVLKGLGNTDVAYNSISVTGEGEVVSVPDVANFSFAVTANAKTVSDAQAQVTKKMDAVIAGLKNLGIDEKDIRTTNYSVYPKYVYNAGVCGVNYCPPSNQVLDGYTASHNVSVKVHDTTLVGEALAVAGDNGATDISSVSFTVDDPDQLMEEARGQAIDDARSKARVLAKDLGVRLVRVVSFYENNGPRPIMYETMGMGGVASSKTESTPNLPTGENKTTVNVTVTYEIR
jgi:uncharacterized protein YggE